LFTGAKEERPRPKSEIISPVSVATPEIEVSTLVSQLEQLSKNVPASLLKNNGLRARLQKAMQDLSPQLEDQTDFISRVMYTVSSTL